MKLQIQGEKNNQFMIGSKTKRKSSAGPFITSTNVNQLKGFKNVEDITIAYKNILFKSLLNSLEKDHYEDSLRDIKKYLITTNLTPLTSKKHIIFHDLFVSILYLKNKKFDLFYHSFSNCLNKINKDEALALSIHLEESTKLIIKKLIIKYLNEQFLNDSYSSIKPLQDIDNYAKVFMKNKHCLIIYTIFISAVVGFKESYFMSPSETKRFFIYLIKLLKINQCKEHKNSCQICDISEKILKEFDLENIADYTNYKKNSSKTKKIHSNSKLNFFEVDKNSTITSSKYSQPNKSEDGICGNSNANRSKSRNQLIKINNNESNKDSMTSIDVKNKNNLSNANVITTQGATNEVSNYQKYIKNTKYFKESPVIKANVFSIEKVRHTNSVISSNNNSKLKINISGSNLDKYSVVPQNLKAKICEKYFEESNVITSTNTKTDHLSNVTMEYFSGNSNSKSFFMRSNFMDSSFKKQKNISASKIYNIISSNEKSGSIIEENTLEDLVTVKRNLNMNEVINVKETNHISDNTLIKVDINTSNSNSFICIIDKFEKSDVNQSMEPHPCKNKIDLIDEKINIINREFLNLEEDIRIFEELNKQLSKSLAIFN